MPDPTTPTAPVKGSTTSEFKLTAICMCLGSLLAAYGAYKTNDHLVSLGVLLAGGPPVLYAFLRTRLKAIAATMPAAIRATIEEAVNNTALDITPDDDAKAPTQPEAPASAWANLPLVLILCLPLLGCGPEGYVRAEAISPSLFPVLKRHDAYVRADPSLSPNARTDYLRSSRLLGETVTAATATATGTVE